MKKLISLLLAMTMTMTLVACGSKEEPAPAPAPAPSQPSQSEPAPAPAGDYDALDDVVLMAGDNSGVGAACQVVAVGHSGRKRRITCCQATVSGKAVCQCAICTLSGDAARLCMGRGNSEIACTVHIGNGTPM